ncbi:hypothetical protein Tco_0079893 [Tanacetum coccineum]
MEEDKEWMVEINELGEHSRLMARMSKRSGMIAGVARVHGDDVAKTVFRMRNGHVEVYSYVFWVNQCTIGFHGVNKPDDRGVSEGREVVREVFQHRGSGAKRKLSRCGRNQMGNEPILAREARIWKHAWKKEKVIACTSRQLKVLMKDCMANVAYTTKYSIHPGADTMLCGFRLTNRWLSMEKDIASCGSKYLAYSEVEVEYQGSSGFQWTDYVTSFLAMLRINMVDFRVLMPRVVKSRDEIFSRWGYCDNHDLSRLDNQSIERDRLIGIGFVLNFVKFISFTFGDKEMISVIEAVSR